MKFYRLVIFVLCASGAGLYSQQQPAGSYLQKDVLDSVEGIHMYTRFIGALSGDSVSSHRDGYNLQGWNEDFYESGKLLHRGYYVDGKLITFKNFYESGACERVVENPDPLHCNVNIFFESGTPRKLIYYYNGLPQRSYEFYENGLPKYTEENEKELNYLKLKKSWYGNGNLESSLELLDLADKKYTKKTYYLNGQLKEEGIVLKLVGRNEYVKEGNWYSYDSTGKKSPSEHH